MVGDIWNWSPRFLFLNNGRFASQRPTKLQIVIKSTFENLSLNHRVPHIMCFLTLWRGGEGLSINIPFCRLWPLLSTSVLLTSCCMQSSCLLGTRWRQLGFQSSDPRSDLRTGILARGCPATNPIILPLPRILGVGVYLRSTQRFQLDRFPVVRGDLGNSWSYKLVWRYLRAEISIARNAV